MPIVFKIDNYYLLIIHFLNMFICPYLAYWIFNDIRIVVATTAYRFPPHFVILHSFSKVHLLAPSLPPLPPSLAPTKVSCVEPPCHLPPLPTPLCCYRAQYCKAIILQLKIKFKSTLCCFKISEGKNSNQRSVCRWKGAHSSALLQYSTGHLLGIYKTAVEQKGHHL